MSLEAGVELDRRVAEAIGWWIEETRPLDWMGSNGVSVEEFRPSDDLNDAFLAAERAGLWDGECPEETVFLAKYKGAWHAYCSYWHVEASTLALAICGAILRSKEESDGRPTDSGRA